MIDVNENEHTSRRRYAVVFFCFNHLVYDDMPLLNYYQCQFHYISRIRVNNRQKTFADSICFSLRVMSFSRNLVVLLLLSINLLSAVSAGCSKLSVLTPPLFHFLQD